MPSYQLKNRTEAEDLIRGLTLFGTGGGGRPEAGREFLFRHVDKGEPIGWMDVNELPDEAWACTVFSMGSTAPRPTDFKEQPFPEYGTKNPTSAFPRAIRELEDYAGKRISVVFPLEIGGSNTPGPMHVAATLKLVLVDGDGSGRAVPEAPQCLPAMGGVPMLPASICDDWGNVLILKNAPSLDLIEAIGKGMSVISKLPDSHAFCVVASYLMPVAELKRSIIPGTINAAFEAGRAIRLARETGSDPIIAAAGAMRGRVLFKGIVNKREWQSIKGYQIGMTDIAGTGEHSGHAFRIWFKNEHHITWKDEIPFVTSPDLIAVVNAENAEPITNTYLAEGMKVAVIGAPAVSHWRTPAGIAALGPKHFGFDLAYRPIEELVDLP